MQVNILPAQPAVNGVRHDVAAAALHRYGGARSATSEQGEREDQHERPRRHSSCLHAVSQRPQQSSCRWRCTRVHEERTRCCCFVCILTHDRRALGALEESRGRKRRGEQREGGNVIPVNLIWLALEQCRRETNPESECESEVLAGTPNYSSQPPPVSHQSPSEARHGDSRPPQCNRTHARAAHANTGAEPQR